MNFSNFSIFFLMHLLLFESRSMFKLSCDFEKDLCNFKKNEFFIRYSGMSPSVSSGPLSDRHKSDGSYILCNGKSLKKDSDQCIMEQSLENVNEIHILEFWYHQYGSQIGTLSLVINSSINVWSSVGRQRNAWTFAKVYLPPYTNKVEFRANRSIHGRFSSDIGIDDISISSVNSINEDENKKLSKLRGENFDKLGELNGWHTNFKNYNWIQTDGSNINNMGPLSDFDSISNYFVRSYDGISSTKNICTIPYTFTSSHGLKEFYCKRIHELNESVCGLTLYPNISFANSTGKCYQGFYMTISSDFYEKREKNFIRSRLISPLYSFKKETDIIYLGFAYNIIGYDSLEIKLEIFPNKTNVENILVDLFIVDGSLDEDKWIFTKLAFESPNDTFRIIFEPYRGISSEPGSVSIDAIDIFYFDDFLLKDEPKLNSRYTKANENTFSSSLMTILTETKNNDGSETKENSFVHEKPNKQEIKKHSIIIVCTLLFLSLLVLILVWLIWIKKYKINNSKIYKYVNK